VEIAAPGEGIAIACGGPGAPLSGVARRIFGRPIDPNRADGPTLETLPGIGPSRAAAILAERARRPFASGAELARVRGIGASTVARLAGLVQVGDGS